jgi:hypothetical protein
MTLEQYEQRIDKALKDVEHNRVKSARALKNEIATWE